MCHANDKIKKMPKKTENLEKKQAKIEIGQHKMLH